MVNSQDVYRGALSQMMTGYVRTQALYVAARLGLADELARGPQSAAQLAEAVRAHPRSLSRFLRYLVAFQLATETTDGRYALAPLGEFLREDHPASLRKAILYLGEVNYPAAGGMLETLRTGRPAFDGVFGKPYYEYFSEHPEVGELFNHVMSQASDGRSEAILHAYDFSGATQITDVGGGNGTLLASILAAHPQARGVLYDLPAVIPEAQELLAARDVADRCRPLGGSFLESVPEGADVYILSNVIHNWNDRTASLILRNCASAMGPGSRLLLVEEILPERSATGPGTVLSDLAMMLLTEGLERTLGEYRALLEAAGLKLLRQLALQPAGGPALRSEWALLEAGAATAP